MKGLDATLMVTSISAVILTVTALTTQLRPVVREGPPTIERVSDWRSYSSAGHWSGPSDARVTIVEFVDFECPYCAKTATDLASLRARYPKDVAVVVRHFPLDNIHAYAYAAAVATECAGRQDRFESVAAIMFAFQDSLGRRSWNWFAERGGVPDTIAFATCIREGGDNTSIANDVAAGERLGVRGTPTIMMNELLFSSSPSGVAMDSIVQVLLSQR